MESKNEPENKPKNKPKNKKRKIYVSSAVLSFPVVMFFLLSPLEVYYSNITDFDFLMRDFVFGFLGVGAALLAAGVLVLSLLPDKVFRIFISLILTFSTTAYIQNMFLNVKLAELDGTSMNWEELGNTRWTNLAIWIVLLAVLFLVIIKNKHQEKLCVYASLFFSAIQMIAFIFCIIGALGEGKLRANCIWDTSDQYKVAPGNNIIVLVMDTLSNDVFEDALAEYPEIAEELKDFTYYSNYDSRFVPTYPSMTHLLTGDEPSTKKGRLKWQERAWTSEGCETFYGIMHQNDYVCNAYSYRELYVYGNNEFLRGKIDNVRASGARTNYRLMYPMMVKYTLYKYLPYLVKPYFEVVQDNFRGMVYYLEESQEVDDRNCYVYDRLVHDGLCIHSDWKNAFVVNHIAGMHDPFTLDENGNEVDNGISEQQAVRGCMLIINEYINQLKELGLYEDACIIITADHGDFHGERRQAAFLIKEFGKSGQQMEWNCAPVDSDDFLGTILCVIGQKEQWPGTSIYDWEEGQRRQRIHYYLEKGDVKGEDGHWIKGAKDKLWGYIYYTDRNELKEKLAAGYDFISDN